MPPVLRLSARSTGRHHAHHPVPGMNRLPRAPRPIHAPVRTGLAPPPALFALVGPYSSGSLRMLYALPVLCHSRVPHASPHTAFRMLLPPRAHTPSMHLLGIVATLGVGIYTVSWAWTLLRGGNRLGAFWSLLLAITSTAAGLWYYWQHIFFP